MTKARRFVVLLAILSGATIVSSYTLGQGGAKKGPDPAASPQLAVAQAPANADAGAVADRFTDGGVLTYQPLKGDLLFALQLQPKLPEPAKRLPRDVVIVISTSAAMAGPGWIGAHQIADGIVQTAADRDQVAIWLAGDQDATRCFTNGFVQPKDPQGAKILAKYLSLIQKKEYASGADDLKTALHKAVASFPTQAGRQRILVYLGNGQSLLDPILEADRRKLAAEMVGKQIAFFPVPLGRSLSPTTLHGLASSTGGLVLRTRAEEEKLTDALKRYEAAFAGPVLYEPQLQLPETVVAAEVYPTVLPPLRADAPTLVVGKMRPTASFTYTVSGSLAGSERVLKLEVPEKLQAADLDNYFLVSMERQWRKAKDQPAVLRADRALTIAYEQARVNLKDLHLSAQLALEKNELDAATRLYQDIRQLAPHDNEANAGITVLDKLKNGTLTPAMLKKSLEKGGKVDRLGGDKAGKARWHKAELAQLVAQLDAKDKKAPAGGDAGAAPGVANPNAALEQNLLQAHRDRMIVEEQKMTQEVEAAVRMARKDLGSDPDGVLEVLRGLLARVKDHPDLAERSRANLEARLQTSLRDAAGQARELKLRKEYQSEAVAKVRGNFEREQQRLTFEDRVEAQFRAFRTVMNAARFETAAMQEVLKGMVDLQNEAKVKGNPVPLTSQAAYTITQAAYHLNQLDDLRRRREEGFLAVMLSIEKSHVPYADEPGIYFPPLATWKALEKLRKDKYSVSSLPNDDEGRKEAKNVERLLNEVIETKDFVNPLTLKDALQLFYDKFSAKGKELPILVDINSFKEENAEAGSPYDEQVQLPAVPKQMTMGTALRLILSQVKTNNATYVIRRNFIEITTNDRMLADKVLRVYPVGDLVIPISQTGGGRAGGGGGFGGGMGGMGMGGMGMGGMGMGGMGMGGMGMGGGMQMGMGGGMMMGGGMQMGMGGGMMMGGGMQMGMGGGMQMGMMGGGMQMGMGGMGMGGMGMGGMGMGGGMMGAFTGGGFQGGFNGSLGMMGATQAYGLIQMITRVVAPGEWFYAQQQQPFQMGMMGGMFGMRGGMFGMNPFGMNMFGMMGMNGMMGAGPPPLPVEQGGPADIRTANTIDFFPPALALIIRAPSRVHYSPYGGMIGGTKAKRAVDAAFANQMGKDLIAARPKNDPKIKVAGNQDALAANKNKKNLEELDPTKIWEEALTQGGVEPGMVIATADFLFEYGYFKHAAEFLKANLRHGIVVRPWVYEGLAIALEASGGAPEEVRRARLSAVALDPTDAQGFLKAAETLAKNKEYDKALSFCRQAAALEPGLAVSYQEALAYADLGKDSRSMEWAVGKILAQDWPVENVTLHAQAERRVEALADALAKEKRGSEADKLRAVLQQFRQRDLIVKLTWENKSASSLSEVAMTVKEPTGSVCSDKQKQTSGGGTLIGCNMFEKEKGKFAPISFSVSYAAGQAFSGDYEIDVRRLWGEPAGNRARLEIVQHAGTPNERRSLVVVDLAQGKTIKVSLKNGRRTELATVSPANAERKSETAKADAPPNPWLKLRQIANPNFVGAKGIAGGSASPGASHVLPPLASKGGTKLAVSAAPLLQTTINGSGLNMTGQVRRAENGRDYDLVMQPIFQAMGGRRAAPVNVVPGAP